MSTDLDKILTYQSIDLNFFEIRGAKSGIGNARTTGPVYTDGNYFPAKSNLTGDGSFVSDSSIVIDFAFDAPYVGLGTEGLKIGDPLTVDSSTFQITRIDATDIFVIDRNSGFNGTKPTTFALSDRDYLIEPDVATNTTETGQATFTQGNASVIGTGTDWSDSLANLATDDFIKHNGFQEYFKIKEVFDNTSLDLWSPYTGDTTTGDYTAKRWKIGRTKIRFAKNDIDYDNQSGKWTYEEIKRYDVTTSTSFQPLWDGITLRFTNSISESAPDIMDVATEDFLVLSRETQYDTFQFSLPVVPHPETMELYINDVKKDMFPAGERDYVISYSQMPVYVPPPPPDDRKVANLMFLDKAYNVQPDTSLTESGQIRITDATGQDITDIMPGSEEIYIDGTSQNVYEDYVLEYNTGTLEITESPIDEQIVKYVGVSYSEIIDYGFEIYLNGTKQKISFPPEINDDVIFQTYTGRMKPRDQDHPGSGDIYQINYMVETTPVIDETIIGTAGQKIIEVSQYPVKQQSIFLIKNGTILDEGDDYFVSYLTGRISFTTNLEDNDSIVISYTPLSKQVNDLTYEGGAWYCTVHDSRLTITNVKNYEFKLVNVALDPANIQILRIYNENKDKDYDLTGVTIDGGRISLRKTSINTSIGLVADDLVLIDYKFANETTEYAPITVNYLVMSEGDESIYIEGTDLTSYVDTSALINLQQPDSATQFYFTVDSSAYDGYGTILGLTTPIPEDVINPKMYISDDPVIFNTVPLTASPITSGSMSVTFPGENIRNLFRQYTILRIGTDSYQVNGATYDSDLKANVISLNSEIVYDATDSTSLGSIECSDHPVYVEATTEITPFMPVVTIMDQPGFIMSNDGAIIKVNADATGLQIDGTTFLYESNPTLGDMSSAIDSSNISSLTVTTYVPLWQSDKIIPVENISIYTDSSTILSVYSALRYQDIDATVYTDTTSYTVSDAGTILLDNPLQRKDRYKLDYMGREFLSDSQVEYSVNFFVGLPAGSKISASFEYDNLDQFYVQVLDQRDFFETVSIPRMTEEAFQLNDNVGQGGSLTGDTNSGATQGGLTNTEYLRKDTEIECRVFEKIYDFFSNRIEAMGNEYDAAFGYRLFNNDGIFNKAQQAAGAKTVNRIFPNPDYTNLEPMWVNPLTGYFNTTGAVFTNGSVAVSNVGSADWTNQLTTGDFIGFTDSTKRYQIANVPNSSSIILTQPFIETSTNLSINPEGSYYGAGTTYPIYDDDGNLGFKVVGTKSGNFDLDGTPPPFGTPDVFNCYIDGVYYSYTFEDPPGPLVPPVLPLLLYLLLQVKRYDAEDVAKILTSAIPGMVCTAERVVDPYTTYGYRNTLVLRSDGVANKIQLGTGSAVSKLGFTPGQVVYGNLNTADHTPELLMDNQELYELAFRTDPDPDIPGNEIADLEQIDATGLLNKLNRIDSTTLDVVDDVYQRVGTELGYLNVEVTRLNTEVSALGTILQESTLPSYGNSLIAYNKALIARTNAIAARNYAADIYPDWQDKTNNWKWVLDFTDSTQYIRGTLDGTGVDQSSGPGIISIGGQDTFILETPAGYEVRFLNATIDGTSFTPQLTYENNGLPVDGSWTGWDTSSYVDGSYSVDNQITFHFNSQLIFTLRNDPLFTGTAFKTTLTDYSLNWGETGGLQSKVFNYGSYPSVQSLMNGINAVSGFGVSYTGYDTNYDYTNLQLTLASPISGYPGVSVYSGNLSPAFSMHSSDVSTLLFNMYSTDVTPHTYIADSSALAIYSYDGTQTSFTYFSYPTVGDLRSAVNTVPNVNVVGYFDSNYSYSTLIPDSGTMESSSPGTGLFTDSLPIYKTDMTALSIWRAIGPSLIQSEFLYASYSTLGILETAIDGIPGMTVEGKFDPSYSYAILPSASGSIDALAPGTFIRLPVTPLFKVYFEMKDIRYAIDLTSVNLLWEEDTTTIQKIFSYDNYPLVSDMKTGIDATITGVLVQGPVMYDSDFCEAFVLGSGPLDATVYSGLRDTCANYQTISDRIIDLRLDFARDRRDYLVDRIEYIDETRQDQIISNIFSEEILRENTGDNKGDPSDLYIWANNRFNRRQGCYARLKQIEKQIESNQSALQINRGLMG